MSASSPTHLEAEHAVADGGGVVGEPRGEGEGRQIHSCLAEDLDVGQHLGTSRPLQPTGRARHGIVSGPY